MPTRHARGARLTSIEGGPHRCRIPSRRTMSGRVSGSSTIIPRSSRRSAPPSPRRPISSWSGPRRLLTKESTSPRASASWSATCRSMAMPRVCSSSSGSIVSRPRQPCWCSRASINHRWSERRSTGGRLATSTRAHPWSGSIDAIRTIASGGTVFTTAQIGTLHSAPRRPSDREIDVIGLVVHGATNAEVAARLGLSEKTIESHLRRLFDRYGLLSRTELAVLSIQEGWSAPSVQS